MSKTKRLLVLYGSQTNTAQEAAERIWRKSKGLGFVGPVMSMDDYSIKSLISEYFVVFVCSTTGQGNTPDNMSKFWKFLKQRNLPSSSLGQLTFGVLALGDSSYTKYNYVGKMLFKRLIQLSAHPLLDIGLCDYQHDLGHEAVMGPWINTFFSRLRLNWNETEEKETISFIPRWKVSLRDAENWETPTPQPSAYQERIANDIYLFKGCNGFIFDVFSNVRTTHESHYQDVRLIELKSKHERNLSYMPGDVFNIKPRNSEEDINDLFSIFESHNLKIKPDQILLVEELHESMIILLFCILKELFKGQSRAL